MSTKTRINVLIMILIVAFIVGTCLLTINADNAYADVGTTEISLNTDGIYTFSSVYGKNYTQGELSPRCVIVSNEGENDTGELMITLSGEDASAFTLSASTISNISVGMQKEFSVKPVQLLDVGTYNATLTVSGENVTSKSFDLKFTVNKGKKYIDFLKTNSEFIHFTTGEETGYFSRIMLNDDLTASMIPELYRTDSNDYVFDGWYTEPEGEGTKITEDTVFYEYSILYDNWTNVPIEDEYIIDAINIENAVLTEGQTEIDYINACTAFSLTGIKTAKNITMYNGLNASGNKFESEEVVETGKDYSVIFAVNLEDGYYFSSDVTVTADNGIRAGVKYGGVNFVLNRWHNQTGYLEVCINFPSGAQCGFIDEPQDSYLNYGESFYFTWECDMVPQSAEVQMKAGEYWAKIGNLDVLSSNGMIAAREGEATFRIVANFANGSIYSNEFTVTWYDEYKPTFIMQPISGSVDNDKAYNYTWMMSIVPQDAVLQIKNGEEWDDTAISVNDRKIPAEYNDTTQTFRIKATFEYYYPVYSDEFTVTWVSPTVPTFLKQPGNGKVGVNNSCLVSYKFDDKGGTVNDKIVQYYDGESWKTYQVTDVYLMEASINMQNTETVKTLRIGIQVYSEWIYSEAFTVTWIDDYSFSTDIGELNWGEVIEQDIYNEDYDKAITITDIGTQDYTLEYSTPEHFYLYLWKSPFDYWLLTVTPKSTLPLGTTNEVIDIWSIAGGVKKEMTSVNLSITIVPEPEYIVCYYPGDGEGVNDSDMILGNTQVTLKTINEVGFTAPENMKFDYWQIGNPEIDRKQAGDSLVIIGETIIIAKWKEILTVTFNANGGGGEMEEVTDVSETYELPECTFTAPNENQQFKGWAYTADGDVIEGESITITEDTELFALWENKPIEIESLTAELYNFTTGYTVAGTSVKTEDDTYTVSIKNWYHANSIGDVATTDPMEEAENFIGGETYVVAIFFKPNGNNVFADGVTAKISGEDGQNETDENGGKTYYAKFTLKGVAGLTTIYINEVNFSSNKYFKNGDTETFTGTSEDYNAYYDDLRGILYLKNIIAESIRCQSSNGVTIDLTGTNVVTLSGTEPVEMRGIYSNGPISFIGDGTLSVSVENPNYKNINTGIKGSYVEITDNVSITVSVKDGMYNYGIDSAKDALISDNASVTINVNGNVDGSANYGIFISSGGELEISTSNDININLNGIEESVFTYGICNSSNLEEAENNGNITLCGTGKITITNKDNIFAIGIFTKPYLVENNPEGVVLLDGANVEITGCSTGISVLSKKREIADADLIVRNSTLVISSEYQASHAIVSNFNGILIEGGNVNLTTVSATIAAHAYNASGTNVSPYGIKIRGNTTVVAKSKDYALYTNTVLATCEFDITGGSITLGKQGDVVQQYIMVAYIKCGLNTVLQDKEDWNVNESGTFENAYMYGSQTVTHPIVFKYAPTYEITFSANGGSGSMDNGMTDTDGNYVLPECEFIAPNGKIFVCWEINGEQKKVNETINVDSEVTAIAIWKTKFAVSFHANGGSEEMEGVDVPEGSYELPECGFIAPEDHVFVGWSFESDGAIINTETIDITADIDLYAIWVIPYAISDLEATINGFSANKTVSGTTISVDGELYRAEIRAWYDTDNVFEASGMEPMEESDVFVYQNQYVACVFFSLVYPNVWSGSVSAIINGEDGKIGSTVVGGRLYYVALTAEMPILDASSVYVNGVSFANNKPYYKNGDDTTTDDDSEWNAYYNSATGELTLNGYNGGEIDIGGAIKANVEIIIIGENVITTSGQTGINSINGGNIVVYTQSDSSLTINVTNDIKAVYGIATDITGNNDSGDVVLDGYGSITINVATENTTAYGIYSGGSFEITESAKLSIDVDNANYNGGAGIYAEKGISLTSNNKIIINIADCGNGVYALYSGDFVVLENVAELMVRWNNNANGGVVYPSNAFEDLENYAINIDTENGVANYLYGTPFTVTVISGKTDLYNGQYVVGQNVQITANDLVGVEFKKWISEDVTVQDETNATTQFVMPEKDVIIYADYEFFTLKPKFARTTSGQGTITFTLAVESTETPRLVTENGDMDDVVGNQYFNMNPLTVYEGNGAYQVPAGIYRVAIKYGGVWFYSETFAINYVYDVYTVRFTCENVSYSGNEFATEGQDYTCVLTPNSGYKLAKNQITVSSGLVGIEDSKWSFDEETGELTIPSEYVTGIIDIYASASAIPTYQVRFTNGGNVTFDGETVATSGEDYSCTLIPDSGYTLSKNQITVSCSLVNVSGENWSFDEKTGELTIPSEYVTGIIDIYASGNAIPTYQVRFTNGGNVTFDGETVATSGEDYSCTLIPDSGYTLSKNQITVSISLVNVSSENWSYDEETGELTIFAEFVTGIIDIYASGNEIPTYQVRFTNGGNVTFDGETVATSGEDYSCTLIPDSGYTLSKNQITVSSGLVGLEDSKWSFDEETGELTIFAEFVTGIIDIYARASIEETKEFTSQPIGGTDYIGESITVTWEFSVEIDSAQIMEEDGTTVVTNIDSPYNTHTFTSDVEATKNYKVRIWTQGTPYLSEVFTLIWTAQPIQTYTVTFDANGGSGTMNMVTEINGSYQLPECEFTAPTGKQFKCWNVGGIDKNVGVNINVTENITVLAIWEDIPIVRYSITATAGNNGTITPAGISEVEAGGNITFTITANSGYHISDVKVNGESVGAVDSYTFENVTENATITVEFEEDAVSHVCNPILVNEVKADCVTTGKEAYYHCECGKNFEDALGETEISNIETWGIIEELGHDFADANCTTPKTCKRDGCGATEGTANGHTPEDAWITNNENHWHNCSVCDETELNKGAHIDTDSNGKCDVCNYVVNTTPENPENPDKDPEGSENQGNEPQIEPEKGLSAGAIAGIAVGSVLAGGIGFFAIFWFVIKKKTMKDLLAIFKVKK